MTGKKIQSIPFGQLNPTTTQFAAGKSKLNIQSDSFLANTRNAVIDRFKKDFLIGTTEFKAVTLKVLDEKVFGGNPLWILSAPDTKTDLIRVIARIPELHAIFPMPDDSGDDWDILALYPVFEGPGWLGKPYPGQIIKVGFQNIYNQQGPMYLGTISGEGGLAIEGSFAINRLGVQAGENPLFPDANYPRGDFQLGQIVIHESVSDTKEKTLRALANNKDKNGNPSPLSVHYIIDKDGSTDHLVPLDRAAIHGDGSGTNHNQKSIGVEVVSPYYGAKRVDKKIIPPDPERLKAKDGKPPEIIQAVWADRGYYIVPPKVQLEAVWKLIVQLTSGVPKGVDPSKFILKRQFPAAMMQGNTWAFYWGRFAAHENAVGIMAHHRWDHSDGLFIEHYCMCRHLGLNVDKAFTTTLENASSGERKTLINTFAPSGRFGK